MTWWGQGSSRQSGVAFDAVGLDIRKVADVVCGGGGGRGRMKAYRVPKMVGDAGGGYNDKGIGFCQRTRER